jgi:hypothetical protein
MDTPKVDQPRVRRNKKERIPVNGNTRNILTVSNREPGYHYRWVINDPDRVAKFKEAWYEPVEGSENLKVGDRKVDTSAGTSSVVEARAGGGKKYVLMRIPEELWQEDQAAKHRQVDESEAEMQREAKKGRYGDLNIDRSGRVDAGVGS